MEKWNKYHNITDNKPPRKNIVKFAENFKVASNAIDLGYGTGRDTIFNEEEKDSPTALGKIKH